MKHLYTQENEMQIINKLNVVDSGFQLYEFCEEGVTLA